jgi:hypothetical protein
VERFFRTLGEGLLEALPGYKCPDVYSRGEGVEDQAFFFVPELEQVIREWVATVYHRRPHQGGPRHRPEPDRSSWHGRSSWLILPSHPTILPDLTAEGPCSAATTALPRPGS